jgi:hypothetical protein
MKMKLLSSALAALVVTSMAAPAFGQIGIYIGRTPPPLRYETRPAYPGDGYSWIDGYWGVNQGRYNWVPGRWDRAPYPGAYWSHPHYDHYKQGWKMREGHWDHEDHGEDEGNNDHHEGNGNHRGNGHHGNGHDRN